MLICHLCFFLTKNNKTARACLRVYSLYVVPTGQATPTLFISLKIIGIIHSILYFIKVLKAVPVIIQFISK